MPDERQRRDGEGPYGQQAREDVALDGVRPDAGVLAAIAEDGDFRNGSILAAHHVRGDRDGPVFAGEGHEGLLQRHGKRPVRGAVELPREQPPAPGQDGKDDFGVGLVDDFVPESPGDLVVEQVHRVVAALDEPAAGQELVPGPFRFAGLAALFDDGGDPLVVHEIDDPLLGGVLLLRGGDGGGKVVQRHFPGFLPGDGGQDAGTAEEIAQVLFFGGDRRTELRRLVAENGNAGDGRRVQPEGGDSLVVGLEIPQHGERHVPSQNGPIPFQVLPEFAGDEAQAVLLAFVHMDKERLRHGVHRVVAEAGAQLQRVQRPLRPGALVLPDAAHQAQRVEPGHQPVRERSVAAGRRQGPGLQERFKRLGQIPFQQLVRRPDAVDPKGPARRRILGEDAGEIVGVGRGPAGDVHRPGETVSGVRQDGFEGAFIQLPVLELVLQEDGEELLRLLLREDGQDLVSVAVGEEKVDEILPDALLGGEAELSRLGKVSGGDAFRDRPQVGRRLGPEPAEIPVGAGPFREMLHDRDDDAEIVPRQDFPAHEEALLLQGFPVGLRPALRDFEAAVVEGDRPGIEREAAAIGAVAQQPELAGGQAGERFGYFKRERQFFFTGHRCKNRPALCQRMAECR